jgi:hypothetical protein
MGGRDEAAEDDRLWPWDRRWRRRLVAWRSLASSLADEGLGLAGHGEQAAAVALSLVSSLWPPGATSRSALGVLEIEDGAAA